MGMCSSNLQKVNAMKEITRIKVKEVDVGLKRKTHAPLEEVLENAEVGKRPKLEEEVVAFGKLLATQMGSAAAMVQPLPGTLQKIVLKEDPTLGFLTETKFNVEEMAEIKRKLERSQGMIVPSVRRSGGLALLWKDSLLVEMQTFFPRHIDAIITED